MLSNRLKTIYDLIDTNDIVADIGTDHGNLIKSLLVDKKIAFCQGVENKIGPYDIAKENLKLFINNNSAILSFSDGLDDLDERVNTVVIAGMGGQLISSIINKNIDKCQKLNKLILQPNSKIYELRLFLSNNGFEIIDEKIIEDSSKIYEIIVAKFNIENKKLSTKELIFGPKLLISKPGVFVDKWQKKYDEINNILLTLENQNTNLVRFKQLIEEVLHDQSQ